MQLELAIAIDDFVDVRQLREVVVDTFHRHHRLMTFIDGERHFFYRLRCHINLRQLANLREHGVVARRILSFHGHHLQLRVELREERCHEVVEAVEHAQHDNQCHCSHDDACHRDHRDHVDGIRRLLRKEVASRYVEGKIHGHCLTLNLY